MKEVTIKAAGPPEKPWWSAAEKSRARVSRLCNIPAQGYLLLGDGLAHPAHAAKPSSVPSILVGQLTLACGYSSRGSGTFFPTSVSAHNMDTCVYINKSKSFYFFLLILCALVFCPHV